MSTFRNFKIRTNPPPPSPDWFNICPVLTSNCSALAVTFCIYLLLFQNADAYFCFTFFARRVIYEAKLCPKLHVLSLCAVVWQRVGCLHVHQYYCMPWHVGFGVCFHVFVVVLLLVMYVRTHNKINLTGKKERKKMVFWSLCSLKSQYRNK